MRNIKTTLRSTRNSGLLFVAASGLLYLTACSSDVLYDAPNENITESNVIIGNDPAAQAHRITFFGNQGTRGDEGFVPGASRAFKMPTIPDFPVAEPTDTEKENAIPVSTGLSGGYTFETYHINNNESQYSSCNLKIQGEVTGFGFNVNSGSGRHYEIYVPSGATYTLGDFNITASCGTLEIHVFSGGKLIIQDKLRENIIVCVYEGGAIELSGSPCTINHDSEIHIAGDLMSTTGLTLDGKAVLSVSGKAEFNGKVYCNEGSEMHIGGDLNSKSTDDFTVNKAVVSINGKAEFNGLVSVQNELGSKLYVNDDLYTKTFHSGPRSETFCNGSIICSQVDHYTLYNNDMCPFDLEGSVTACGIQSLGDVTFKSGAIKTSYLKVGDAEHTGKKLDISGNGSLTLDDEGLVEIFGNLNLGNPSWKFQIEEGGDNAGIVTDEIIISDTGSPLSCFPNENITVQYNSVNVETFKTSKPSTPVKVKSAGCHGEYPAPGDDPEEPTFKPIAVIDGPTHEHNHLSATCVQEVGEGENARAYVSYHLNAEYNDVDEYSDISEHMGCVEVYDVNEERAQITSWLMNQDFDFNHLIVDDNKVYTTGDTRKYGATLGVIDLATNGSFQYEVDTEGREGVMTYYNLYTEENGEAARTGSGNCIIRDNNSFRIASYNGFQSFDVNDLTKQTELISTSGSAKHIAKGKNHIVTLNLDQKKVKESTATVTVYSTWGTQIAQFKTNKMITPIDGKNVIATDDENIYVALGENGVDKYDMNGNLKGHYSWITEKLEENPDYVGRPLANGLCVDENYIYVANGAAGMIVLDKNEKDGKKLERVARYCRTTLVDRNGEEKNVNYSANYVQKVGKYIYIAYGRNGLEVVKMTAPLK